MPTIEILLPVHKEHFFMKCQVKHAKSDYSLGQFYIRVPISKENKAIKQLQHLELSVTSHNEKVGVCIAVVRFEDKVLVD